MLAHGVDLVDVHRFAELVERQGEALLTRCFTPAERGYADRSAKRRMEHLAARFAAKEAVLKALGTGWAAGIGWTDIEVVNEPSGRPVLRLTGKAAELAAAQSLAGWTISLSHTATHAIASVIAHKS
jgi:holo-[acyl-carrier protein] synthase